MALHRNIRGGKPSPYNRIAFHALRAAQLLGAMVVSGVMAYFIDHLKRDISASGSHFSVPWTFILLLSTSLATIVALIVTIIFYNFTYLSPRFNLILNSLISVGWGLGLGLLTWSIAGSQVLQKSCTAQQFGSDAGAGVCREYKALWSMTLCATVGSILALLLDVSTLRKEHRLGEYKAPEDDLKSQHMHDMKTMRVRKEGYETPDEQGDHISPTWQAPEEDITYRGSFAETTRGPLDANGSAAGYRDH